MRAEAAAKPSHSTNDSPHFQNRDASVMPMSEAEAKALVREKDATGRRVLDKGHEIQDGQVVGVRANLNLKKATGITIQTMHAGTEGQLERGTGLFGGEAIGYQAAVTLRDVKFSVSQEARAAIAEGRQNKFPMASVDGHYVANPPASRFNGVEIKFNPMRHHLFVDPAGRPIKSAERATVVGGSVFVSGKVTYYTEADMPTNKSTVSSEVKP